MENQLSKKSLDTLTLNEILRDHWPWLLGLGIVLTILGTISILVATLTTLVSIIAFGIFLLVNGGILTYQSVKLWWRQWWKFFSHLAISILYIIAGLMLIFYPLQGAVALTLLLALFYIIIGFYRGVLAITHRIHGWQWMLLSAVITVILGTFILIYWPGISLLVIGIFVGVDIIFLGWAFIMSALAARSRISEIDKKGAANKIPA